MQSHYAIIKVIPQSFRINIYTMHHFRHIGLIDVMISFPMSNEKVTLAFYSSSGTNSGKIKGLWYPILGIKRYTGRFTEFTPTINEILTQTTLYGDAHGGWLAKSLFFAFSKLLPGQLRGYATSPYYEDLYNLGQMLRTLYESGQFVSDAHLNVPILNKLLMGDTIYPGNHQTQRSNFETYMKAIYETSDPYNHQKKA